MCRVMLVMIIFVLDLFKFQVIRNSLRIFLHTPISCLELYHIAHHLAVALVYFSTMSFSLSRPYSIFSIILLHNKESVSRTICSISAGVSRVAPTGADKALHNLAN